MMENNSGMLVHDEACEKAVLGAVLNNVEVFTDVCEVLSEECFYNETYKEIWKAIVNINQRGDRADIITTTAELASQGSSVTPVDVMNAAEDVQWYNAYTHAVRLRDLKVRRSMWLVGQKLIMAGVSEAHNIDETQQQAVDGLNNLSDAAKGVFTLTDAFSKVSENIVKNIKQGSATTGTRTGFVQLDRRGGLQPSDLIIVGGESSNGKTSLAMSIAVNAIQEGAKIVMYSMEMTKEQLAARVISTRSGVMVSRILYDGTITDEELRRVDAAKGHIASDNMFFDDNSTSNIDSILFSIRSMKKKYNIDGAIVDYLQILNVNQKSFSREQAMGDASRRLKNIAKELGIWVMALSQLNRDSNDPVPNLNRLRDSGQIQEAADVVIFVYRPEKYNRNFPYPYENRFHGDEIKGKALIKVDKGRNIGMFQFIAEFDEKTTLFTDYEEKDTLPPPPASHEDDTFAERGEAPF